jgi:hypothetical protein
VRAALPTAFYFPNRHAAQCLPTPGRLTPVYVTGEGQTSPAGIPFARPWIAEHVGFDDRVKNAAVGGEDSETDAAFLTGGQPSRKLDPVLAAISGAEDSAARAAR